jgi:hypothetical protein
MPWYSALGCAKPNSEDLVRLMRVTALFPLIWNEASA